MSQQQVHKNKYENGATFNSMRNEKLYKEENYTV